MDCRECNPEDDFSLKAGNAIDAVRCCRPDRPIYDRLCVRLANAGRHKNNIAIRQQHVGSPAIKDLIQIDLQFLPAGWGSAYEPRLISLCGAGYTASQS